MGTGDSFEQLISSFTTVAPIQSAINKYLATDSGGYLCMKSLQALITVWLNYSRRL